MARKKAVVIGGGVHGLTSSIALAENGVDVTLLEKNYDLMKGTSGATHNRAHMGYHYPRSEETVAECQRGLKHFMTKYPLAIVGPKENFYLIAQDGSNTSFESYLDFCGRMELPYEVMLTGEGRWNDDSIEGGIKVP